MRDFDTTKVYYDNAPSRAGRLRRSVDLVGVTSPSDELAFGDPIMSPPDAQRTTRVAERAAGRPEPHVS